MVTVRVRLEAVVELNFQDLIDCNIQELIDDMTVEDLAMSGDLELIEE